MRGTRRERHGLHHAGSVSGNDVTLGYTGLDGLTRRTVVSFATPPDKLSVDGALFELVLQPGETRNIDLDDRLRSPRRTPRTRHGRASCRRCGEARRTPRTAAARAAAITSSNTTFNEAIRRSISDLYMLITDTPDGPYPYAGIPWFSTVFGRDALITAHADAVARSRHRARRAVATWRGTRPRPTDEAADAEPGKILHEMRQGEMALLGEVPFRHYYGSVDSTPLFVMLAGAYLERTDDVETVRRLWPNILAALRWMDESGDRDGDGFIEYGRKRDTGLINQGWKDSHDLDLPRRRHAGPRAGRPGRGPGLCLRRLAGRCRDRTPAGRRRSRRRLRRAGQPSAASASTTPSSTSRSAPTCWPSTATSGPAGCAPPTPATRCSAASPSPSAPRRW